MMPPARGNVVVWRGLFVVVVGIGIIVVRLVLGGSVVRLVVDGGGDGEDDGFGPFFIASFSFFLQGAARVGGRR